MDGIRDRTGVVRPVSSTGRPRVRHGADCYFGETRLFPLISVQLSRGLGRVVGMNGYGLGRFRGDFSGFGRIVGGIGG